MSGDKGVPGIPEDPSREAAWYADRMIEQEISRQDKMWGESNERADVSHGELMHAGVAQIVALDLRQRGDNLAFSVPPLCYPHGWSGFRDYGSDIANLVVAAAFIRQEIKRKIMAGEDTTRTSRDQQAQPYDQSQTAGLPNEVK